MSYSSMDENPQLGIPETDTLDIKATIDVIVRRDSTVVGIEKILSMNNAEDWANCIIEGLIHNLSYDSSVYGRFGTPEGNIIQSVKESGNNKKLWVKLLGIKMNVLVNVLDTLPISEMHRDRIRNIDRVFRGVFKSKK